MFDNKTNMIRIGLIGHVDVQTWRLTPVTRTVSLYGHGSYKFPNSRINIVFKDIEDNR